MKNQPNNLCKRNKSHKSKNKPSYYIDSCGRTHIVIKPNSSRNELHFETQLRTRMQIIESKKHKAPKHKKKIFEDE